VIPFIVVGGFLMITAQRIKTRENSEQATLDAETSEANAPQAETTEDLIEQMRVHALEILLAPNLVDIVSDASDDLLARCSPSATRSIRFPVR